MPPVGIAEDLGRDSGMRGHRLEPVLALWMSEDVSVIENQRFERHADSKVSRHNDTRPRPPVSSTDRRFPSTQECVGGTSVGHTSGPSQSERTGSDLEG